MNNKALVLFSGGQDSTTCLAYALNKYDYVETIGFNYGQRHAVELTCRSTILNSVRESYPDWGKKLGEDHMLDLQLLGQISDTGLTKDKAIEMQSNGLPSSFVPGRNLLFVTFAAAIAYRRDLDILVTGVCETDYSGYPDCRDDTIKALQIAISLGMDRRVLIDTPLMWIDKAATWSLADQLGGDTLIDIIKNQTHTCYMGDHTTKNEWGYGCGTCPACEIRKNGYEKFVTH
jgi:7-cyano-7-deazaguanine synthase